MKQFLLILLSLIAFSSYAQQPLGFGSQISQEGAILSKDLSALMGEQDSIAVKVQGRVGEVCQAKGCWMTMDLGQEQSMRITFKDYGFFVPKNSSGKTAIVQGIVKKELISVETLRHYAKDAGKSTEEIASITTPETSVVFVADGVLIKE